jgi:hypothetical protein
VEGVNLVWKSVQGCHGAPARACHLVETPAHKKDARGFLDDLIQARDGELSAYEIRGHSAISGTPSSFEQAFPLELGGAAKHHLLRSSHASVA